MPLKELGPDEVLTAPPDSTLEDVTEELESAGIGSMVITEDDDPVGIITDRDIALEIHKHDDVGSVSVADVMTENPAVLREDEDPIEISRAIKEHNVRRFPIVDDSGSLTGIVTLDDLVATIGEQLENVADTIAVQSPEYSP